MQQQKLDLMRRIIWRKRALVTTGVFTMGLVASFSVASSAQAREADDEQKAAAANVIEAKSEVSVLSQPATKRDGLSSSEITPGAVTRTLNAIEALDSATRFLGEDPTAKHWGAVNDNGELCLITYMIDDSLTGATCMDVSLFTDGGLPLSVQSATTNKVSEAYFVPDGFKLDSTSSSDSIQLGANLIVTDARDKTEEAIVLESLDGKEEFELRSQAAPPDSY